MTALQKLQKAAIELPASERADLASTLIRSLDVQHHCVTDEEVARRGRELEDGSVEEISHEELLANLRRKPAE